MTPTSERPDAADHHHSLAPFESMMGELGLPARDPEALPRSPHRFPDGASYRVEIPSVEGPRAFEAVLEEAHRYGLTIHRISQGSGIMLLTDDEILAMARLGAENGIEVSLFVGPRSTFDIGAHPRTESATGLRVAGMNPLLWSLADIRRATLLGIRSVLVADEGLLWLVDEARQRGLLPEDLLVKISAVIGPGNPAYVRVLSQLGAGTCNVQSDLTLSRLAAIRQAVELPLDIYVEVPDGAGGFIRYYELADIVRVAAPVYLKFGLSNAPSIYPSGTHLEETAVRLSRERVRRAYLGLKHLLPHASELTTSESGAEGLAVPVV